MLVLLRLQLKLSRFTFSCPRVFQRNDLVIEFKTFQIVIRNLLKKVSEVMGGGGH